VTRPCSRHTGCWGASARTSSCARPRDSKAIPSPMQGGGRGRPTSCAARYTGSGSVFRTSGELAGARPDRPREQEERLRLCGRGRSILRLPSETAAQWLDAMSPWPRDGFGLERMRALLAEVGNPQDPTRPPTLSGRTARRPRRSRSQPSTGRQPAASEAWTSRRRVDSGEEANNRVQRRHPRGHRVGAQGPGAPGGGRSAPGCALRCTNHANLACGPCRDLSRLAAVWRRRR
jgi:hypothetical protein